jgi:arsenate reductase
LIAAAKLFMTGANIPDTENPEMVRIYHNPRCSKSRQTLALIEEKGIAPEIITYLDTPPSPQELGDILAKLGLNAEDIVRKKEAREEGIADLTGTALIEALCAHPRAIERPIVINGDKAVLGRPPENVLDIL